MVLPRTPCYQPYVVDFMRFFHGTVEYDSDKTFIRAEILDIEPMDVKRWLANKAYHDPNYDVNRGERPLHYRYESISMAKKALSHFMIYRTVLWCNDQGNPTRSAIVNDLLKEVKKFEVRGEGAKPNAK